MMPSESPPEQLINLAPVFDPDLDVFNNIIVVMNILMVPPFILQIKLMVNTLCSDRYGYWQLTKRNRSS
jgi:hypothetical protein